MGTAAGRSASSMNGRPLGFQQQSMGFLLSFQKGKRMEINSQNMVVEDFVGSSGPATFRMCDGLKPATCALPLLTKMRQMGLIFLPRPPWRIV